MAYSGWLIQPQTQLRLLAAYPPRYPIVRAHHVTYAVDDDPRVPEPAGMLVVGRADDDRGIEALLVRVNGLIRRPDGRFFHITLSREEHRASKDSNDVLALMSNWRRVQQRVWFSGTPFSSRDSS